MPALPAFVAGNPFPWIAADKKSLDGVRDDGPVVTIVFGIEALIAGLKLLKVIVDNLKEG